MTTNEHREFEEIQDALKRLESTQCKPDWSKWIPVYLALAGLLWGVANTYTVVITRVALLEQQITLLKELVTLHMQQDTSHGLRGVSPLPDK